MMNKIKDFIDREISGKDVYRCPEPGCTLRIALSGFSKDERKRLAGIVLSHPHDSQS